MLQFLENIYAPFFDPANWIEAFSEPADWMIIISLVIMECLLSVDNAVVLAAQTKQLPTEKEQKESLVYGLWGAYLFRFLIIGIGTYLIHMWFIKVIGAGYLMYLAISHLMKLRKGGEEEHEIKMKKSKRTGRALFWQVVIAIEAMDIVFSIDSVLASLAMSPNPVVILIGGMIGILSMRGVAEVISKLMEKIPELETMAYVLIIVIAIKLFLSIPAIDIEMPSSLFFCIVVGVIAFTVIYHYWKVKKQSKQAS